MSIGVREKKKSKKILQCATDLFPKDEAALGILVERAKRLAYQTNLDTRIQTELEFIRFSLGGRDQYGIGYNYAQEVIQRVGITKVPCVPDFIEGVINRRGLLLSVINLQKFLNVQTTAQQDPATFIIVVKGFNNLIVGILANKVAGSQLYDPANLDPPFTTSTGVKSDYLIGLHQGKIALLNIESICMAIAKQFSVPLADAVEGGEQQHE